MRIAVNIPRPRTLAVVAGGAVVLGGAGLAAAGIGGGETPQARSTLPPATATVERTTLVETEEVDGTLGYGTPRTLSASGGKGMLTALAGEGRTVSRGQAVYRVDNTPVPLLYGRLPVYRTLRAGTEGPDVEQLERNLRELGYTGFTVDDTFSHATTAAVQRWQEDLGVEETGRIEPGSVAVASGPIRIAEHKKAVGDPASGAVLTYTGTSRIVTVDLEVDKQHLVDKGAKVAVEIPGGDTVTGKITKIGTVATEAGGQERQEEADATIEVIISVPGDGLGRLDQAPVQVHLTAGRRRDVLAVPISALLALPDGGYGVQVVQDGSVRTVAVEVGMFAGGLVEVSGTGLAEGMKVGIPT